MRLSNYLGADVSELLMSRPFSEWAVSKYVEEDLPRKRVYYKFDGHGVELICDEGGRVDTIFLYRGDGEGLSDVPFSLTRKEVLVRLGSPSKSGTAGRIAVLGDYGAWDQFSHRAFTMHVQ